MKDMTRKELALRTSISYNYLSSIENGYDTPSDEVMTKLSKALDVAKDNLYFRSNRVSPEIVHLLINDKEVQDFVLAKITTKL